MCCLDLCLAAQLQAEARKAQQKEEKAKVGCVKGGKKKRGEVERSLGEIEGQSVEEA